MYHRSKPKAGKVSKGMIGIHQISVLPMISKISFLPVSLRFRVIRWIFSSGKPPLWRRQYPDILNSRALQPSNAQFRSPTPVSVGAPLWRMRNYGYPIWCPHTHRALCDIDRVHVGGAVEILMTLQKERYLWKTSLQSLWLSSSYQ